MSTVTKIIVERAYISGFIPFLTSVYILVDKVSIPGRPAPGALRPPGPAPRIPGHGEGHEESGEDARQQIWENNLEEGFNPGCAQIHGGFKGTGIELFHTGHDA